MISRTEILSQFADVLEEVLGTKNIKITEETTASDISGWDSLTHVDIILATEEKFNIRITASQSAKLKCLGELVDLIESQHR